MAAVLRGRGRDQHERVRARRRLDVLGGRLPQQRAYDVRPVRPVARVLQLGERPHEAQPPADAAVDAVERRQPEALPRAVEVAAAVLEPPQHERVHPAPETPPARGARQARAERVGGRVRRQVRMHVRDQRRDRHALQLPCKRRAQGEDVRHHRVRSQPRDVRPRVARRAHDRLVGLQRRVLRREDGILGRGDERQPGRLGVRAPALPGLERDRVTASRKRRAEREHREGVAGIAERAQEQPQRLGRSCARTRPEVLVALGEV